MKRQRSESEDSPLTEFKKAAISQILPDIWRHEEEVALKSNPDVDYQTYKQTCNQIRNIMTEILDLKIKKSPQIEIEEKRIQACLMFASLKKLNRLQMLRISSIRNATNNAKNQVENIDLDLQNNLYQDHHFRKEIGKCNDFESKGKEVDLVSIDDFYKEAPENITKPEITKNDQHQLMLGRLQWELKQRQQLVETYKQENELKEKIKSIITVKNKHLDGFAPRLTPVCKATKKLQVYVDQLDEKDEENGF